MGTGRDWRKSAIGTEAYTALASGLPASTLWSLFLDITEQRAAGRRPAQLLQQWRADRFVQPSSIDQRILLRLDEHLFAAAPGFEAIELSPLAPLGSSSVIALTSQNRVVSTMRGTEVVSDPTNVMALESARRLRANPQCVVKLATSHRCVRAQEVPKRSGFAAHFRMFCLTTAGHERKNQAFVTDAMLEHIRVHLRALDRLEQHGYSFPDRRIRLLAREDKQHLAERIAGAIGHPAVSVERLEHGYYDGLRFMIDAGSRDGGPIPLIDGGAFNWLHALAANRKLVLVASAIGSQLLAHLYRRGT
ncbi:MAG TPA: hypothetical protein VF193_06415 [Steroidobacter sp.]